MNSTQMVPEVVVLKHHKGLNHQVEADLIEQKRNHSLQSVMPAGILLTTPTINIVITSNSKGTTQEERNVLTVTGSTSLRIVRK